MNSTAAIVAGSLASFALLIGIGSSAVQATAVVEVPLTQNYSNGHCDRQIWEVPRKLYLSHEDKPSIRIVGLYKAENINAEPLYSEPC